MIGFFILASGTLIFNEIIVIRYFGFDVYTAEAIAKRKHIDGKEAQDENYVSLSPHAAYDSKRNQRGLHSDETPKGSNPNQLNATQDLAHGDDDTQEYMLKTK